MGQTNRLTPIEKIMYSILLDVGEKINLNRGADIFSFYPQYSIGRYRVDFLCKYMDKEYIIECDGHDFHEKTKEQATYDKRRERFLITTGRKVLRFSGTEIFNDSDKINEELVNFFELEYCNGYACYPSYFFGSDGDKNDK